MSKKERKAWYRIAWRLLAGAGAVWLVFIIILTVWNARQSVQVMNLWPVDKWIFGMTFGPALLFWALGFDWHAPPYTPKTTADLERELDELPPIPR